MKIVIIGLGSMGKRRLRLIRRYEKSFQIVGVDFSLERRAACEKEYQIETFATVAEALNAYKIEAAFLCTSPLSHSKIMQECLNHGLHVFTELNLVADGYDESIALAGQKQLVIFMSSTMIYREEIQKIIDLVDAASGKLNYCYHIGQYLPDWHPWENYKDFFVGDKRTNGCREILAIEIPWLIEAFGPVEKVNVIKDRMSGLELDYNDNYLLLLQHKSGHKGSLAVDVVSRKAVRNLEVFGENLCLQWDGSPTGLYLYDIERKEDVCVQLYDTVEQREDYSGFIIENAYFNEISTFFESIHTGSKPRYTIEQDKAVLQLIDRIEL